MANNYSNSIDTTPVAQPVPAGQEANPDIYKPQPPSRKLSYGTRAALAYSPNIKQSIEYLKSNGYDVYKLSTTKGVRGLEDVWVVPKGTLGDSPTDDEIKNAGDQGHVGFLAGLPHAGLPTAGAIIGGALGTPLDVATGPGGTIGGAALGAGSGAALNQVIAKKLGFNPSMGDVAADIATESALGAAGPVLGKAGGAVARAFPVTKELGPALLKGAAKVLPEDLVYFGYPRLPMGDIPKNLVMSGTESVETSTPMRAMINPETIIGDVTAKNPRETSEALRALNITKENAARQMLKSVPGKEVAGIAKAAEEGATVSGVPESLQAMRGILSSVTEPEAGHALEALQQVNPELAASLNKLTEQFMRKLTQGGSLPTSQSLISMGELANNPKLLGMLSTPEAEEAFRKLAQQYVDVGRYLKTRPQETLLRQSINRQAIPGAISAGRQ